jgi:mycoredoxin
MTPQPEPDAPVPEPVAGGVAGEVVVYWRPGCPFCSSLRGQLRRAGVPTTEINIWDDPAAAAEVRRHAAGNETVPTVVVGDDALVNPSAKMVVALAARAGIALVEPTGWLAHRRNRRRQR